MAQFHPHPLRAAIDAVVQHEPHADAVLDGHHREIRQPAPVAEPQLGQRAEVRVIVDGAPAGPAAPAPAPPSGTSRSVRTEDHRTRPSALSTKPGTPMPTADRSPPPHPRLGADAVQQRLDRGQDSVRVIAPGAAGHRDRRPAGCPRSRRSPPVCSRSDSFMPATRCASARTPSATAGRPRPSPPSRGAATSSIRPASISSEVMVVTEAGLTPRSLATCTRGISPAARTRSNTCWRSGRSVSDSGGISGPQPFRSPLHRVGDPRHAFLRSPN